MDYEPLEKVRKELKVKWQRPRINTEKLRQLNERSDAQGWFQTGGHLLMWLVTGTFAYYFWSQSLWLAFLIALFCHGVVASFFLGHVRLCCKPYLSPSLHAAPGG